MFSLEDSSYVWGTLFLRRIEQRSYELQEKTNRRGQNLNSLPNFNRRFGRS